jgi:hypothetical protein
VRCADQATGHSASATPRSAGRQQAFKAIEPVAPNGAMESHPVKQGLKGPAALARVGNPAPTATTGSEILLIARPAIAVRRPLHSRLAPIRIKQVKSKN